jgi:hypothetical protein
MILKFSLRSQNEKFVPGELHFVGRFALTWRLLFVKTNQTPNPWARKSFEFAAK